MNRKLDRADLRRRAGLTLWDLILKLLIQFLGIFSILAGLVGLVGGVVFLVSLGKIALTGMPPAGETGGYVLAALAILVLLAMSVSSFFLSDLLGDFQIDPEDQMSFEESEALRAQLAQGRGRGSRR